MKELLGENWSGLAQTITEPEQLACLPGVNVAEVRKVHERFPLRISRYYLSLIQEPGDPIWKQVVPDAQELVGSGVPDPLHEHEHSPVPCITHRYPDRVLFRVTNQCATYCRFCTRKWKVANPGPIPEAELQQGIEYVQAHPEVRDVVLSGGDPLMLSDQELEKILRALRAIPHVQLLRIGTRMPVTLPQRITPQLCAMLRRYHPVYLNTHFNHPREVTPESTRACELLADAGIPVGNQSVLLRGVNDDPAVMKELVQQLLRIRVRPYYIYQADLVQGTDHFRTSVQRGLDIIAALQGHTTGLAVPHFVIDTPGGGGKVRLQPNPVVAWEDEVTLRNFEGNLYRYPSQPSLQTMRPEPAREPKPEGVCLHELFEAQVDRSPASLALTFGKQTLSYRELDARANQLARHLRQLGLGAGDLVAIYLERSLLPVVAMLACFKAGAGYVPIDPMYPVERMRFIFGDAQVKLVLTERSLSEQASAAFAGKLVLLDADALEIAQQSPARLPKKVTGASASPLAYVIYTSGTTGRPKGVMTEHRSVVHFLSAFNDVCGITPADRIYQGFSPTFDGSVEEIWMALAHGASLVIGSGEIARIGPKVAQLLNQQRVTVFSTVPTMLSTLERELETVRLLIVSGEVCGAELVRRWAKPGRRLLNVYGPTETTVNTTVADCVPETPVTIGRPLRGYRLLILDSTLRPAPEGEPGELYIGGPGVARGYLNQPDLTAQRFIANPLPDFAADAPRLYRTGDRVRMKADGNLEFLGRIDDQVKIRGFRVELGEIEGVLLEQPQVRAAAVKVVDRGGPQLAAYLLMQPDNRTLDRDAVLAALRRRLPEYMVPAYLDVLESFPTLTSGKTDRARLPEPVATLVRTAREMIAPRTEAEQRIAAIWERTLKVSPISVVDNFFTELGGHSLVAAQTVSQLRQELGLEVAVRDIYRWPTIEQLAQHTTPGPGNGASKPQARTSSRAVFESLPWWSRKLVPLLQAVSLYFVYGAAALPLMGGLGVFLVYTARGWPAAVLAMGAVLLGTYPTLLLLSIAAKWLLIGRYRVGSHPVWGWYYLRWWLVGRFQALGNPSWLAGTPLLSLYYRLMGAQVGPGVILDTPFCSAFDLVSIGANSAIGAETHLLGYLAEDGYLRFGTVAIGRDCFVGVHSALGLNVRLEDGARLGDLSVLTEGETLPAGESRCGSPAVPTTLDLPTAPDPKAASRHPARFGLYHFLLLCALQVFVLLTTLPSAVLVSWAFLKAGTLSLVGSVILAGPLFVLSFCLLTAAARMLLLPHPRPGVYPLESALYLRKWAVDFLMMLSRGLVLPLYTTIYLPPWLRLLGARIGKRAELSTVWQVSPELLEAGEESFFADGAVIGRRRLFRGCFEMAYNRIGRRTFVGNNALLPVGASLGNHCLLGVLSMPPKDGSATADGTEWLGSPAFRIPARQKVGGFSEAVTYRPPRKLYAQRLLVDGIRILVPALLESGGVATFFVLASVVCDRFGALTMATLAPVVLFGIAALASLAVVLMKLAFMGRFRPAIKPLWSVYVWLNEAVNGAYEAVASPALAPLLGTPFLAPYLRLLGCKIGRRAFLDSMLFSEFDLVEIGDYAALNPGAVIQTHLFEDRIMKSSYLRIETDCSVGNLSVVLYDTRMQPGSKLAPLSLLMKGESLPPGTAWSGIPIGRHSASKPHLVDAPSASAPKRQPARTQASSKQPIKF